MQGKPYAENPLVAPSHRYGGAGQFDEGKVAPSATPRCGSLLYKGIKNVRAIGMAIASSIASTSTYDPETCKFSISATDKFDADYRPLLGTAFVDAGSKALYDKAFPAA